MDHFVENVRQIGIFMIAAQAVIHLAPEKRYEKYIKLIAGIIVLLLFTTPFLDQSGEIQEKWQTQAEQIIQEIEEQQREGESLFTEYGVSDSKQVILNDVEENIRERLSGLKACEGYEVTDVKIQLAETGSVWEENTWEVQRLYVGLRRISDHDEAENEKETEGSVHVDKIVIDKVNPGEAYRDSNRDFDEKEDGEAAVSSFKEIFSGELGISESCVEVDIYE